MTCTIRAATRGDSALIHRFVRDLARYEHLEGEVALTEADVERDFFSSNPKVFCDIAEWEGAPAGFAVWFYTFSTFQGRHGIWLEDLFVDPELRERGIGRKLLQNLATRCVQDQLGRLEWWVLDWNAPSIGFYKAQGAVLQDEWTKCRVSGPALAALAGA